jgi:Zn-dependent peptidase ImmA (M78 family)/DNA-binding XRE family transcriptional regulator
MGDKAFVTPSVMKWARETAKMTIETAAEKIDVTAKQIAAWENGVDRPTVAQAKKAANVYRRPFALFMLPAPPQDFTPLRDFRRKGSTPLGTAAAFIIRDLRQKQTWVKEWYEEQGEKPLPFVGRFSLRNSPATVAADMLRELGIQPPNAGEPIKEWLAKAEAKGIFISRTSYIHSHLTLNSDEFQGFAIADPLAPFVFINTDDWNTAQLFTLVHELAHLWIAESGISGEIAPEYKEDDAIEKVERFCNQVAAIALMPKEDLEKTGAANWNTSAEVYAQAQRFGVSSLALLVRTRQLGLISGTRYARLKKQAEEAFRRFEAQQAEKKKNAVKGSGGPDAHRMQVYRNGLSFSRLVMDVFRGGLIPATLASTLMGAKVSDFSKLEKFAYP